MARTMTTRSQSSTSMEQPSSPSTRNESESELGRALETPKTKTIRLPNGSFRTVPMKTGAGNWGKSTTKSKGMKRKSPSSGSTDGDESYEPAKKSAKLSTADLVRQLPRPALFQAGIFNTPESRAATDTSPANSSPPPFSKKTKAKVGRVIAPFDRFMQDFARDVDEAEDGKLSGGEYRLTEICMAWSMLKRLLEEYFEIHGKKRDDAGNGEDEDEMLRAIWRAGL